MGSSPSAKFKGLPSYLPPILLAITAYALSLNCSSFIRDDWPFIVNNPLFHSAAGLFKIWTTGYVQTASGNATRVFEYRPFVLFSFYIDRLLFGLSPGLMHITNISLHALNCGLLMGLLRRFLYKDTAIIAAMIFAVMPIHSEAICGLANRTELLVLFSILSAWILLDSDAAPGRILLASVCYIIGLLSKEHAIFFPVILVVSDWIFHQWRPWDRNRRLIYACLLFVTGLYLLVRRLILKSPFQVGESYFAGVFWLNKLLTVSRFWIIHYAWPTISGMGLCNDFSRPLIIDSPASDLFSWLCMISLGGVVFFALWSLYRRQSKTAFWMIIPFLFLFPSSHFLVPFDTLGAQRFLYIPTISFAVGLGWIFIRFRERAPVFGMLLFIFYLLTNLSFSIHQCQIWASDLTYYQEAVRLNPLSPNPRIGLAMAYINRKDRQAAVKELQTALLADSKYPSHLNAPYNLGKIAWEAGNSPEAEHWFGRAYQINPQDGPTLEFLALIAERKGLLPLAEKYYLSAINVNPYDSIALFNLGRLYLVRHQLTECKEYWNKFLEFFPDDPVATRMREILASMPQKEKNGNPIGIK